MANSLFMLTYVLLVVFQSTNTKKAANLEACARAGFPAYLV